MKILNFKFLLKYYDPDELQYFYELLKDKMMKSLKEETVGNERFSGHIWKLLLVLVERSVPQAYRFSRMSKKSRDEFVGLAAEKIEQHQQTLNDPTTNKEIKEAATFSLLTMKLLIAVAKEDDLF